MGALPGRNGRFLREGEEGGGGGNPPPEAPRGGFKPPQSQEEFDRIIQDRVRRATAPFADYDTWKAKGEQFDVLARESQTDREREINEAREEAFQEAMSAIVPRAVKLAFRAEAKGVLSDEQVESLLEDLDLTRYATDDGDPDTDKISKKVAAFAPKGGSGSGPGFGQGAGYQQSTRKGGELGLAEAQRRFGSQKAGSSS